MLLAMLCFRLFRPLPFPVIAVTDAASPGGQSHDGRGVRFSAFFLRVSGIIVQVPLSYVVLESISFTNYDLVAVLSGLLLRF